MNLEHFIPLPPPPKKKFSLQCTWCIIIVMALIHCNHNMAIVTTYTVGDNGPHGSSQHHPWLSSWSTAAAPSLSASHSEHQNMAHTGCLVSSSHLAVIVGNRIQRMLWLTEPSMHVCYQETRLNSLRMFCHTFLLGELPQPRELHYCCMGFEPFVVCRVYVLISKATVDNICKMFSIDYIALTLDMNTPRQLSVQHNYIEQWPLTSHLKKLLQPHTSFNLCKDDLVTKAAKASQSQLYRVTETFLQFLLTTIHGLLSSVSIKLHSHCIILASGISKIKLWTLYTAMML